MRVHASHRPASSPPARQCVQPRPGGAAPPPVLTRHTRPPALQPAKTAPGVFITVPLAWDLIGTLSLPLGVVRHVGSTVIVGVNGPRLLRERAWAHNLPKDIS
ncbi:hypothetical protein E4U91_31110 [Streptomyces lasalocidi]|uniref:Uncharacterized protein n=1 Tax=Streptomyces lasalocidi TaxID=324833 RepID=A0A4U5WTE0_STRLS|nr:hypothetical protein E4U91_31110 [Streptomyces lasalocidi]